MNLARAISHVRRVRDDLAQFCYPAICAACEAPAPPTSFLCESCDEELRKLESQGACEQCAMPLASDDAPCPWCEGEGIRPFRRVLRVGTLSDPLKHLVHRIKYHEKWSVAEKLTDRLLQRPRVQSLLKGTDVFLPVPLHPVRQIVRGYNQADVIARRLASRSDATVVRPVVRMRATKTQTHLHGRAKHAENLKDAFGLVDAGAIFGKRVTIVDDVLTTGATLHALAMALKPAAPAQLDAIVLAVADPDGRDFQVV
jgi:ComF family protein